MRDFVVRHFQAGLLGLLLVAVLLAPQSSLAQMVEDPAARVVHGQHVPDEAGSPPPVAVPPSAASSGATRDYILGSGDKVKVTVFGEPDLSGEFQVSSTGELSLPLIGPVK